LPGAAGGLQHAGYSDWFWLDAGGGMRMGLVCCFVLVFVVYALMAGWDIRGAAGFA
jgi:hypothetical protein